MVIWVVYVIALQHMGFILASIAAIALTMLYWGAKNYTVVAISSVLAPVIVYLLLGRLLGVRFPTLLL